MRARVIGLALVIAGAGGFASTPAAAQATVGLRAGTSINPDQFYFGAHLETAPIADRLRFKPNVEVGIGDNTLVAFNFEFADRFPSRRKTWHAYAGGGPALNIADTPRDTRARGGFNLLLGAGHESGLFAEIKAGLVDSPDLKIGVGYSFR
ncbi:MAG: hypothetical protein ACT4QD_16215 [Acidobacteriota bacterium]